MRPQRREAATFSSIADGEAATTALFLLMLLLLLLQSPQSLRRLENLQSLQSLARRNHDQSDSKNGRHSRLYGGQEMDMFTRCTAPGCSDSGSTSSNWM